MKRAFFVLLMTGLAATVVRAQPLTLEGAMEQAQAQNPVLRQRLFAAEAAGHRVRAQRTAYLPVLTFTTSIARANEPPKIPITIDDETFVSEQGSANSMQLRLQAEYMLFDFGKRKHSIEAARYEQEALEAAYDGQVADVVLQLKQQFYRARFYARLDSIYEAGFPFGEQLEQISQAQVANGAALPLEVLRAQVALQNSRAQQALARSEAEKSRIQLAQLLGRERPDFYPAGHLPELPDQVDPAQLFDALYEQALRSRQEFKQFEWQRQQQAALARLTAAQARPSVVLQSSAVYYGPKSAFGVDVPDINPYRLQVGLGLTYNVLGRVTARIRSQEIEATRQQLDAQAEALRLDLSARIRALLSDLRGQQAVLRSNRALLEQVQANADLLAIDYQNGAVSLLVYTNARVTVTEAAVAVEQTRFAVAQLLLQLERVVGAEIRFLSE